MAVIDRRYFALILASPSCWTLNNRSRISAKQEHDAASALSSVLLARVYFFFLIGILLSSFYGAILIDRDHLFPPCGRVAPATHQGAFSLTVTYRCALS